MKKIDFIKDKKLYIILTVFLIITCEILLIPFKMSIFIKAYGQLGQDAGRLKRTGIRAFGAFGGGREPLGGGRDRLREGARPVLYRSDRPAR